MVPPVGYLMGNPFRRFCAAHTDCIENELVRTLYTGEIFIPVLRFVIDGFARENASPGNRQAAVARQARSAVHTVCRHIVIYHFTVLLFLLLYVVQNIPDSVIAELKNSGIV